MAKDFRQLSREEELEMFRRYREDGDLSARDRLVESQTALARRLIAKRMRFSKCLSYEHALAEAPLCVFDAVERFDVSRGVRLATAVGFAVQSRLGRFDKGGAIYIPVKADKTDPEAVQRARTCMSIDTHRSESDERAFELPTYDDDPADKDERENRNTRLTQAISRLPAREAAILRGRFFEEKTRDEVGRKFGITKERVRQIELAALEQLRTTYGSPVTEIEVREEPPESIVELPTTRKEVLKMPDNNQEQHFADKLLAALGQISEQKLDDAIETLKERRDEAYSRLDAEVEKLINLRFAIFGSRVPVPSPKDQTDEDDSEYVEPRKKFKEPSPLSKQHAVYEWLLAHGPAANRDIVAGLGESYRPTVGTFCSYYRGHAVEWTPEGWSAIPRPETVPSDEPEESEQSVA